MTDWREIIGVKKTTLLIRKGKRVFSEGERVEGIYFLYEGSAKIFTHWGEDKELILRFARSGDILGHRGFGGVNSYPISASVLEDSKICFIPNQFFETTLKTNPGFTQKLLHVYASDLLKAEKRMRDLAHMEVKGRIALALLELQETFGAGDDQFLAVPVLRQDIASFAGTTYETVFKFFKELIRKKIISTKGKDIRINNSASLKKFIQHHV